MFVQKFNFYKTLTFSRVFHPKKIDNFLGQSKLIFWTKNEDFEQCAIWRNILLIKTFPFYVQTFDWTYV